MNELAPALSPAICKKLGVECDECVKTRACSVARISPGLSPSEGAKFFRALYPSQGCAPMRDVFLISYREQIELTFGVVASRDVMRFVA
jgi:hypothetical protein